MNTLVINKNELRHNIEEIKELIEKGGKDDKGNPIKIIATLKNDAYGLGQIEFAKNLIKNGITFFAVETIEEAIELREAGIKEKILLLTPTAVKEDIEKLIQNNIIITLGSKEDIETAEKVGKEKNKKVKAHICIDTGKGLQGFIYSKRDEMIESLKTIKNIEIEGTFSEFYDSSNNEKFTKLQFERFIEVIEILKMNEIQTGMLHICDSSAFFKYTTMNLNAVRIGRAFIGQTETKTINLRQVAHIETKVSEIKEIPKGFYLGNYKTKKEIKIAIIPYNCTNKNTTKINKDIIKTMDKIKNMMYNLKSKKKYLAINKKNYEIIGKIENNIICEIGKNNIKVGEKVILPINNVIVDPKVRKEYR